MRTTQVSFGLIFFLILSSCSISKNLREQRNLLSGTWQLDNVSYANNTGNFKSILFGDAEDICFEGTDWFFRDNNSTGRYTVESSSLCQGGDRFIRWSVRESTDGGSQLQFKFIDAKRNEVSSGFGYRLDIAKLDGQTMTLKSNVTVDDQPITVIYEFTKK